MHAFQITSFRTRVVVGLCVYEDRDRWDAGHFTNFSLANFTDPSHTRPTSVTPPKTTNIAQWINIKLVVQTLALTFLL